MSMTVVSRHRGPYQLLLTRTTSKKLGYASEWLPGEVSSEDVASDALALLNDPRDTITSIHVWSLTEEQFVTTFSREKAA